MDITRSKPNHANYCHREDNTKDHIITSLVKLLIKNNYNILIVVITSIAIGYLLYFVYKVYWDHYVFKMDLQDVGFSYIPSGPDRAARVAGVLSARRAGTKPPPPYPNGWYAVAESGELASGGVKAVDALGENLCVYRGEDDIARCVDAYCPHLGAHLAVGGAVCGDCIECPFHRWRFGADGALVSVPGLETAPKGISIKTWRTVEADGAVWIWYDAEGREPLWQLEDAPELKTWRCRGRNEFIVGCHIQEIPENGADVAHLNAVHSSSLLTSLAEKYPILANFIGTHHWTANWQKGEGADSHTAVIQLTHDYKICKLSLMHLDVVVTQLGPGHVRLRISTPAGPLLIAQSVTPLRARRQRVAHRVFSPKRSAPLAAVLNWAEARMIERDIVIWNNKKYISSPIYVKTDKSIKAFRTWFSQFYSEHSISFKEASERTLEW